MVSRVEEEYIKTIYLFQQKYRTVHNSEIARALNVKSASVTEMLQKLYKKKLVTYRPYKGATLTVKGRKIAEKLVNRYNVLTDFLQIIGVDRETAEIDACNIEHIITSDSVGQLKQFVENNLDYSKWRQVLKRNYRIGNT